MYLKKLINKKTFDKNGYVLLNTSLSKNLSFDKLCSEIETCLNKLIKNSNIKKLGGYIVGNLNVNQGPFGLKLYSLVFKKKFQNYFEKFTSKKINQFDIRYGGNLALSNKGMQHFHTDGGYNNEMYLVSIATEDITLKNGPTEVCVGSHTKIMSFDEFFFSKKKKKKITMKKGQILIRKHNLWHRGTKNYSDKPRLLLSFIMTRKNRKNEFKPINSKFEILRNSFHNNLISKIHETIYVKFSFLIIFTKLFMSFCKKF